MSKERISLDSNEYLPRDSIQRLLSTLSHYNDLNNTIIILVNTAIQATTLRQKIICEEEHVADNDAAFKDYKNN